MNIQVTGLEDAARLSAWDRFVDEHPQGHYMQTSAWGALRQACGWEAHLFLAMEGGDIAGGALLLARRLPGGKGIFYLPRGPVVSFDQRETAARLLDRIIVHVREDKGIFLRMEPYLEEDPQIDKVLAEHEFQKLTRKWSHWNSPNFVLWLDLEDNPEKMFERIPRDSRRKIRATARKGVVCQCGTEQDLEDFQILMKMMGNEKGIGVHRPQYFENLYRYLIRQGKARLFVARHEGKVISAGVSTYSGKTAWLLYLAAHPEYRVLNSNRALQWEMIRWAIQEGCTRYDFRGSATNDPPSPEDPGYGVYRFKDSFGPRFVRTAGYYDYVVSPLLYRLFILSEDLLLPLAVKTYVGISRLQGRFAPQRRGSPEFQPVREKRSDA